MLTGKELKRLLKKIENKKIKLKKHIINKEYEISEGYNEMLNHIIENVKERDIICKFKEFRKEEDGIEYYKNVEVVKRDGKVYAYYEESRDYYGVNNEFLYVGEELKIKIIEHFSKF